MGMILIIGIAAYLIYINMERRKGAIEDTPLETLKKRYARGEITHEEFEQIKKDIEE
jgi:putative membrane protein